MEETKTLEKIKSASLRSPFAVPIASYPSEVISDPGTRSLMECWQTIRKRRLSIISIALLVIFTAMIFTLKQQPFYTATTVLQIDRETPNVLAFQGFAAEVNPFGDSYLETAYEVLKSRSLALRVIEKLNLERLPEFNEALSKTSFPWLGQEEKKQALSTEEQLNPKFSKVVDSFQDHLSISPVRRSQLVEISYESHDPVMSARIANNIANEYTDMNLEAKWEATQKASDWLTQQLVGLKAKLEKSEEDLQVYAKENSILFLDEKQSMNSEKLKQLQEEATKAQADLIQKESIYNQLRSGNVSSSPGIFENKLYQDLTLKLSDLRQQYTELSGTFTPEYPRVKRLKGQIDEVTATLERERNAFSQRAGDEYKAAANRSRLLDQALVQQTSEFNKVAEKSIQYNILKREADTNKELYNGLLQRLKEAGVSAGLRASNVRVVDEAEVPQSPSRPRKLITFALSLFVGLTLGVGLAFLQEYLDNTLKSPADVQRYLRLPNLGVIPSANDASSRKLGYGESSKKSLASRSDSQREADSFKLVGSGVGSTIISEAYRSLRTSVLLSTSDHAPRIILITSAHPGEGKTTTAINLSIALAQLGGRVLIIDSDLRRPRVESLLKLPSRPEGLSTYLTGRFQFDEVVGPTSMEGLFALPAGPLPPNPAELLSSERMMQMLELASQHFDYTVLDSPPVLHVADARILAARAETTVLVAHGYVSAHESVLQAKNHLEQVGGNIIGVVLNNVDIRSEGYGSYGRYNYGYAEDRS
jgi:polysaccharide biosynthesis transport protein